MVFASKLPCGKHVGALVLALLGPVAASPQDKPPAAVQGTKKKHHGLQNGLTAVGLPAPWGASAPVSSIVQGHLAPTVHASGQASSSLWACIVAGAGAVGHNIRQNREPRNRRQPRRGARQVTPAAVAPVAVEAEAVESDPEVTVAGWQTESEDESMEHLNRIGKQNQIQFLQQVMGHEMQGGQSRPNPFPQVPQEAFQPLPVQPLPVQPLQPQSMISQNMTNPTPENPNFQYYDPQFNQQMMYWQQPMQQTQQLNHFNQQMQMQMHQSLEQQPRLQPLQYNVPEGMVLVVVPVEPGAEQGEAQQPQRHAEMDSRSSSHQHAPVNRAPSVSSIPSEISTEIGSSVSTQTAHSTRSRARWNNKDCEAVVRQLQTCGLDALQRRRLLEQIAEDAWTMAITKHGTRVVQAALEVADLTEKLNLVMSLRGRVWQALKSPHANHVLQKAISHLPPKKLDFVVAELRGRVGDAARHPFGCRVLERLLEHCPREQTEPIAREVLADVVELSKHAYGNYVVQHTLEHGSPLQKQQLCEAMRMEIGRLARHKVASHVVECALLHSSPDARQMLKDAMASNAEELASDLADNSLTASNYGSFVVKEMKKR
ncbi:unnamed protein product [Cladocopium goreaui]|uniref:Pumilio-like 5 n=1 Tax=Cladocopium goreaui TaxID=2562237 RepID=A0A9P1DMH7_9DINO|nr:unnamed protein product [Cladocopium goreaui]